MGDVWIGLPRDVAHPGWEVIWGLGISFPVPSQHEESSADWLAGLVGMEMRG